MRSSIRLGAFAAGLFHIAVGCGGGASRHPVPTPAGPDGGGAAIDGGVGPASGPDGGSPDGGSGAPPLDPTVASGFASAFRFLYEGPNATQTGVTPGAIDDRRVAIVRGLVEDPSGAPVEGVRVSSPEHPEYGSTVTGANGTFDFVVNGGGALRVSFNASGYLPLEREVQPAWQSFEPLHPVFLTRLDAKATEVTLGSGASAQLVQGSSVSDRSGARTGALLFASGTTANIVLKDGTKQALTTAHVRITEYTAGDNGPKAMPATLPPESGYTYAVELTVDEAAGVDAKTVQFSKPVPYYVQNFLKFPVGEPVPAGYYDRDLGHWVAEPSGRVVSVVDVIGGSALLDVDGDGLADDGKKLTDLGIDDAELTTVGGTYAKGTSLWRIPVSHFSTWDFNWCFFGALFDATTGLFGGTNPLDDDCQVSGSLIECSNQILGESVPLAGLPVRLHYRSDRVPGRREAYLFDLRLTNDPPPPKAKRVRFEMEVLGRHETYVAAAAPNLTYHFEWDGLDGYGRRWQGPAPVRYRVGYVYDGWYGHTPVFGTHGEDKGWAPAPDTGVAQGAGVSPEDDLARRETTMWLGWQSTTLGTFDASDLGFGGFTLGNHHTYDPNSRTLYLGTGDRRHAGSSRDAVHAVIGDVKSASGSTGDPLGVSLDGPHGLVVAPDGAVYLSDENHNRVVKLTAKRRVELVAGVGTAGYSGDGGPAASAELNKPLGLALAKDGTLYIAERGNVVVRRVKPDGTIDTFAGGSKPASGNGDGGPAAGAVFAEPHALAMGLDGSLFIADANAPAVRRVRTDGIIETVFGNGTSGSSGDGGPAVKARLQDPLGLAVGPDGSLYIADYEGGQVRKLAPDGTASTVAGTGFAGDSGDGGPATAAALSKPHTVDVGPDGSIYIADEGNFRIRKVTPDGIIHALAGGGTQSAAEFVPAADARFTTPRLVAIEQDGRLLVGDYTDQLIYRMVPFLPSSDPNGYTIASPSGDEYFVFDASGRHTKTVDSLTGQTRALFSYGSDGRLTSVRDENNRATTITRDASGRATEIASPDGLVNALAYSDKGWLSSVVDPAGEKRSFTLDASGLLKAEADPAGRKHAFDFDDQGRLIKDTSPTGAFQSLSRGADRSSVTRTTARGLSYGYARSILADGQEQSTSTLPDGRTARTTFTAGHERAEHADGTIVETTFASDPRFGLAAKYPSKTTITTPGGRSTVLDATREVSLSNPDDPASVQALTSKIVRAGLTLASDAFDVTSLTRTIAEFGTTTVVKEDSKGHISEMDPPGGRTPVAFTYDTNGRLTGLKRGSRVRAFVYDSTGSLTTDTDALGVATTLGHDAIGRVISTDRGSATTGFVFDSGGDLTSLVPPLGNEHAFGYDTGGRAALYRAPVVSLGKTSDTTFTYGLDDFLEGTTFPSGKALTRTFDGAGRLTQWVTAESTTDVTYDGPSGQVASVATRDETVSYGWDGALLLSMTYQGTVSGSIKSDYDDALRLAKETVGADTEAFVYDNYGRMAQAGAESIRFDADGTSLAGTTLGQLGEYLTYSSDFGELAGHRVEGGSGSPTLYSASFTRDALGRITKKDEVVQGATTSQTFEYDDFGNLKSASRGTAKTTYSYDADGNRLGSGASVDAQDRLLAENGNTYTYDADGRLATRARGSETRAFTYDTLGGLIRVDVPGHRIDYVLDPLRRRVGKKKDGVLVQGFLYDGRGRVIADLDGAGALRNRFVYGARQNVPDYMIRGGLVYRLVADYLGSVRLVVDSATSKVAESIDYDAWGNVLSDTSPGFQPFGFAGGIYDGDTALVRFGARDYDPETGRWTSKDPILFGGGQANLYVYVGNDPIDFIDPDGRFVLPAAGALIGAGAAAYANWDAYQSGRISGMDLGAAVAFGAGTGALAGFTGGILGGGLAGGLSGAANDLFRQGLDAGCGIDLGKTARAGAFGLATGLAAGALARLGSNIITPNAVLGQGGFGYYLGGGARPGYADFGNVGGILGNSVGTAAGSEDW